MYCGKCGAEIPDDSTFCGSCGTPVSGEAAKKGGESQVSKSLDRASQWVKSDTAGALILFGALLLILGTFLPWTRSLGVNILGLNLLASGAVICALGVLLLVMLVLSRTSTNTAWGAVMLLLSALTLALIFQSFYYMKDNDYSISAGLWIAMLGAIIVTAGAVYEQWGTRKE